MIYFTLNIPVFNNKPHFRLSMSHIEPRHNLRRRSVVAMDLDSLVDTDHQVVSVVDGDPMTQVLHDQVKPFHFHI